MNKLNNKGQVASVGAFILLFVGLVVGLSLVAPSAQNLSNVVNTAVILNQTITFPTNTTAVVLVGQRVTNVAVQNSTSNVDVPATNYTITNYGLSSTGTLQATIIGVTATAYSGQPVNISYTYEPLGYAKEQGSRTVTNLIILFAALAILGFTFYYLFKKRRNIF